MAEAAVTARYTRFVLALLRRHPYHCLAAIVAAVALRAAFILCFAHVTDDSRIYADIARNWLHHGSIALTEDGHPVPSLIRLPGYPAFLAAVFALFGDNNFAAVMLLQLLFDLGTCLLIASLAAACVSERGGLVALWLAALCPYTANYVALPLTETLAIFFAALACWFAVRALRASEPDWRLWAACGLAINAGIYLRPDGGIILAACLAVLGIQFLKGPARRPVFAAAVAVSLAALLPLAPWAYRNWRVFHQFQPLAPRYANAPDEFVAHGFNRWTRTWIVDYASVDEVYWKVPSEVPSDEIDLADLPARAFDTPEERRHTEELFDEYNESRDLSPRADAAFAALADSRIRRAPLRYYVTLPALRIADMWLRPRTEMLDLPPRWWDPVYALPWERNLSILYSIPGIFLMLAGMAGAWLARRAPGVSVLIAFILIRSAFLGTLENPEPRYTLEMMPALIVLAAAALSRGRE